MSARGAVKVVFSPVMQPSGIPGVVTELGRPLSEWKVGAGKIVLLIVVLLIFPGMFIPLGFLTNEPVLGVGALALTAATIWASYFFLSGIKLVIRTPEARWRWDGKCPSSR
jgi:hypothetical protein